jgi:hypothetical protein
VGFAKKLIVHPTDRRIVPSQTDPE